MHRRRDVTCRKPGWALFGSLVLMAWLVAWTSAVAVAGGSSWSSPARISDKPNYPGSKYRGAIDGDGRVIPCLCRFSDKHFRLGDVVCMSTHLGTVLTRCDLIDNNTSWIPTDVPCVTSRLPSAPGYAAAKLR